MENEPEVKALACGLPCAVLQELRNVSALNRLSQTEAADVFDKLLEAGFKVVAAD